MTGLVAPLVLGAALMHASWNAILHSDADRLWSMMVMRLLSAASALPFALAPPAPASCRGAAGSRHPVRDRHRPGVFKGTDQLGEAGGGRHDRVRGGVFGVGRVRQKA
ncbi:MAG TPA: hypothetical protein VHY32_04930 [Caulobacteraceae bacterium]|nr:hypothetical protein [Caulobacteraceae bacterium]